MIRVNKGEDASLKDINLVNEDEYPTDTVSSIAWAPQANMRMFACSDWGCKIRLYKTIVESTQKEIVQKACFSVDHPCLSVKWSDDCEKIFTGSTKNTVEAFDVNTGQSVTVGRHDAGVRDVHWIPGANTLCSLSFDRTMKFWDLRQQEHIATFNLGLKVFCSDLFSDKSMVIGLQEENILVLELSKIQYMLSKNPLDYIDSPLGKGSQITAIEFFSDGSGVGIASCDGRVNLSSLEIDSMGRRKLVRPMSFKVHKTEQVGNYPQRLYPVNAIGFHPKSKYYLFTAGGEGNIFFWDFGGRNKITGFNYKGVPVTRAKMSPDGLLLAYSLGDDWARGIEGYMSQRTKVCAHIMKQDELLYSGR